CAVPISVRTTTQQLSEQSESQTQKNRPEPVWGALVVMILAVQRPIGCPGVAACVWVNSTIGGVAIERPMGSADQ
ncbi:hypothetical protein, partial [Serratia marcescens]